MAEFFAPGAPVKSSAFRHVGCLIYFKRWRNSAKFVNLTSTVILFSLERQSIASAKLLFGQSATITSKG